jgi:hypothetical protein
MIRVLFAAVADRAGLPRRHFADICNVDLGDVLRW